MARDANREEAQQGTTILNEKEGLQTHADSASGDATPPLKSVDPASGAILEADLDKPPFLLAVNVEGEDEDAIPEDDPRLKDLPPYVRRVVSLTDDPNLPVFTFRYFVLSMLFVCPGAFLSMMSHFRTTYAPYSIFFVQIACSYVGDWWAKTLPAWQIRIPGTRWGFNLNPGPFSVKEHVMVVLTAASGATCKCSLIIKFYSPTLSGLL
jgi:hypothetical protein